MTTILAAKQAHGRWLLAADRRATSGNRAFDVTKISMLNIGCGSITVAGTGSLGALQAFIDVLSESLRRMEPDSFEKLCSHAARVTAFLRKVDRAAIDLLPEELRESGTPLAVVFWPEMPDPFEVGMTTVVEVTDDFETWGSGGEVAAGAWAALSDLPFTSDRLERTFQIAASLDTATSPEFDFIELNFGCMSEGQSPTVNIIPAEIGSDADQEAA